MVCRPRYWQVQLDHIAVGLQQLNVSATQVIVDSGSTLIYASLSDAQQINQVCPSPELCRSLPLAPLLPKHGDTDSQPRCYIMDQRACMGA